jgi:hypothetical protein
MKIATQRGFSSGARSVQLKKVRHEAAEVAENRFAVKLIVWRQTTYVGVVYQHGHMDLNAMWLGKRYPFRATSSALVLECAQLVELCLFRIRVEGASSSCVASHRAVLQTF